MPSFLHILSGDGPHLLALQDVVEVLPMVALDRGEEPASPRYCGLLEYRGEVLPTFSLTALDDGAQLDVRWMLVVAELGSQRAAWVARDVLGVLEADPSDVLHPQVGGDRPPTVVRVDGELIRVLSGASQ